MMRVLCGGVCSQVSKCSGSSGGRLQSTQSQHRYGHWYVAVLFTSSCSAPNKATVVVKMSNL